VSHAATPLGGRHLLAFFLTTFAITWGLGGLYFLFPEEIERLSGPVHVNHPLFMTATYAPAIAALSVIAASRGRRGLRAWFRHRFVFRVHWGWYLAVVGGIFASSALARVVAELRGTAFDPWPSAGWAALAGAVVLSLVKDPGGVEELGWRGFAQPLLQRRTSALNASLLLGFIWGLWHLPAFFIPGAPQGQYALGGFIAGSMIISVLMGVVFNGTRGSIPLAFLFHWANNDALGLGKSDYVVTWMVMCLVVAGVLVWRLGPRNLGAARYVDPLSAETAS
jgi:membrane protease YdiL (CAAX protease family)